jgi:hypothetical protein
MKKGRKTRKLTRQGIGKVIRVRILKWKDLNDDGMDFLQDVVW